MAKLVNAQCRNCGHVNLEATDHPDLVCFGCSQNKRRIPLAARCAQCGRTEMVWKVKKRRLCLGCAIVTGGFQCNLAKMNNNTYLISLERKAL